MANNLLSAIENCAHIEQYAIFMESTVMLEIPTLAPSLQRNYNQTFGTHNNGISWALITSKNFDIKAAKALITDHYIRWQWDKPL